VYSRCISCRAHLGRNQALEAFPVGRRLAFDTHTGRLWALCAVCRTWNLSPIEERWEAVEEAERLFETAAIGSSTEHIALGRIAEGTELVRVGRADRQEFAGWRYSRKLVWRYWTFHLLSAAGAGAAVAGMVPLISLAGAFVGAFHLHQRRAVFRTADGEVVRRGDAIRLALDAGGDPPDWTVRIPKGRGVTTCLEGGEALYALRRLLPSVNADRGRSDHVREAVDLVRSHGAPGAVIGQIAHQLQHAENRSPRVRSAWELWHARHTSQPVDGGTPVITLALEMAVNEEMERRALAGEVELLEREWQEAEELAAIADDLLFPRHLRERLRALKQAGAGRGRPSERVADLER
jgi:hypothetical protein